MSHRAVLFCMIGGTVGVVAPASGAVVFSNVTIGGTLAGGSSFSVGADDIDFSLLALVGDVVDPLRSGNLTITFNVTGTAGEHLNKDILSVLGGVEGSGLIKFSETVDDLTIGNEGQIASFSVNIDTANPPPQFADIVFSRASSTIKVTKTLDLSAAATAGPDTANVNLIEQRFVPTPGAIAVAGLMSLAGLRRRR